MIVQFSSAGIANVHAVAVTAASLASIGLRPRIHLRGATSAQSLRLHAMRRGLDLAVTDGDVPSGFPASLSRPILVACRGGTVLPAALCLACPETLPADGGWRWRQEADGRKLPSPCPSTDASSGRDAVPDKGWLAFTAQVVAAHVLRDADLSYGRMTNLLAGRHAEATLVRQVLSRIASAMNDLDDSRPRECRAPLAPPRRPGQVRGVAGTARRAGVNHRLIRQA